MWRLVGQAARPAVNDLVEELTHPDADVAVAFVASHRFGNPGLQQVAIGRGPTTAQRNYREHLTGRPVLTLVGHSPNAANEIFT